MSFIYSKLKILQNNLQSKFFQRTSQNKRRNYTTILKIKTNLSEDEFLAKIKNHPDSPLSTIFFYLFRLQNENSDLWFAVFPRQRRILRREMFWMMEITSLQELNGTAAQIWIKNNLKTTSKVMSQELASKKEKTVITGNFVENQMEIDELQKMEDILEFSEDYAEIQKNLCSIQRERSSSPPNVGLYLNLFDDE